MKKKPQIDENATQAMLVHENEKCFIVLMTKKCSRDLSKFYFINAVLTFLVN